MALVGHALGVPLDGDESIVGRLHRFDHVVGGPTDDGEWRGSGPVVGGLVMERVRVDVVGATEDRGDGRSGLEPDRVSTSQELLGVGHSITGVESRLMPVGGSVDVLAERAAESHVGDLEPTADGQNRLAQFERGTEQSDVGIVGLADPVSSTLGLAPVDLGIDVVAATQHEPVEPFEHDASPGESFVFVVGFDPRQQGGDPAGRRDGIEILGIDGVEVVLGMDPRVDGSSPGSHGNQRNPSHPQSLPGW